MTGAAAQEHRTLGLVIPVRNDAARLAVLLQQAADLGCFSQVVIADDASEVPVSAVNVPAVLRPCTTVLRSEMPGGAGRARNLALETVVCSHLVFFDSDDLFTEDFPWLWREVERQEFDFCLFKHNDSRMLELGKSRQMPMDDALWRLAGCAAGGLRYAEGAAVAYLAETANYPWNKIYRAGFLRENRLRFSEIPVHNDIEMHWRSFACAARILVSDRIAATHFVHERGQRLTNLRSAERLRVFEPLAASAAEIRARQGGGSALMLSLLRFSCGLAEWVRNRIDKGVQPEFDRRAAEFLRNEFKQGLLFDWLSRADPVLALRITLMIAQGAEQRRI